MIEIDKIAWVEIKDGKILSTRSRGKSKFYIPGGKRENGESDEETLIREIQEELSVDIIPSTIQYVGTFKAQSDGHAQGVIVKMTCYKAQYAGTLIADSEIEEIRWLSHNDMDIISEVDKIIFDSLRQKGDLK